MYENQIGAAKHRGEPVDMNRADTMRRMLLGNQEQGDLFGAEPEKPKRTVKQSLQVDRPIQQSLEGLDDGMLFSTFSPKKPPQPGQKGWGDRNMSLRAEQAIEEGRRTAGMIAKEYGLKPQTVRSMLRSKEWHHVLPKDRKTPVSEYFYDFHPETDEVDAARLQEMKATDSGRKSDALQKRTRTLAAKNLGLKHNASTGSVADSEGNHIGTFRPWGFDASTTKNKDAAKQIAERMGLNRSLLDGNYYTEEKSHPSKSVVKDGVDAMERVISEQTDVPQAMSHPLIGDISFYWGNPGTEAKNLHDGHGISHIIAARNAQSQDGIEAARHMVRVVAEGQIGEPRGPENGKRVEVTLGEATAVLSLFKGGNKETWLLTGWKESAPDVTGESNNRQSYTRQSSGGRTDAGAGASTNQTIPQPTEDVKSRFSTTAELQDYARSKGYTHAVWRGSKRKGSTVLDPDGGALWFTDDKDTADHYQVDRVTQERTGETRGYFIDLGDNPMEVDAQGNHWSNIPFEGGIAITDLIVSKAMKRGHTSVIIKNVIDGGKKPSTVYALFKPEQVKLSDTVTRDDQGNEIPLERRFDKSNSDVRYSTKEEAVEFARKGAKEYLNALEQFESGQHLKYNKNE